LSLHGDGPAGVVAQRHAELPVEIGLVGRFSGGERAHDVPERLDQCLHLAGAELLTGDLLADLCFESSALALCLGDPRGGEGGVDVVVEELVVLGDASVAVGDNGFSDIMVA